MESEIPDPTKETNASEEEEEKNEVNLTIENIEEITERFNCSSL